MDVTLLCHCCLRGAPDRAMTTPYSHLGKTETYADLLRDCFDIYLVPVESGSSGICWACVGRLRDASDFKLQVQHSQAELLKASLHIEYDVKSEPADDSAADGDALDVLKEEPVEKSEIVNEEETSQLLQEQSVEKSEIVDEEETSQELDEQPVEIIEIVDEEETSQELPEDPAMKLMNDSSDDVTSDAGSLTAGLLHSQMLRSKYCTIIEEEGIKKFQCAICERTYRKWALLRQHFLRCHLNLKKTTYRCSLCGEEIVPWAKARHLEQAHGVQPPTCKDCGKTFAFPHKLRHHQRIYHMGERNHSCEQCGVRLTTAYGLKTHMYTHATDRPFKCEFCSKAFKSPNNLELHKRIHLNDRRFVCNICNVAFVHSSNLRYHMNKRHPELK